MAEGDLDVAVLPNETIAAAWNDFTNGKITKSQYDAILNQQRAELSKTYPAYGIGGQGYIAPMLNVYQENDKINAKLYEQQEALKKQLAGKAVLEPTAEKGIYSASVYQETGELKNVDTGKGPINPFAASQKTFYSETGRKLTAAEVAASKTGQQFAAAGWDIGFGPGMIAPGVRADTSEREAREASTRQASSSSESRPSAPAPSPTPPTPAPPPPPPPPVRVAPIDTILYPSDAEMPIEIMADLIFENIGGQELINISRNDTINGQPISYQPIKNISLIQQSYNPNNILSLQQTSDKIFAGFAIKQESKVPNVGNGPNGSNVYRDEDTGDIVIEFVNIEANEQADIQFAIDGTIYEVNL